MSQQARYSPPKGGHSICQYFRNEHGSRIGVFLAVPCDDNVVRIGWSKLNKPDHFNLSDAFYIANNRCINGFSDVIPFDMIDALDKFVARAKRYYKESYVQVPVVVSKELESLYDQYIGNFREPMIDMETGKPLDFYSFVKFGVRNPQKRSKLCLQIKQLKKYSDSKEPLFVSN